MGDPLVQTPIPHLGGKAAAKLLIIGVKAERLPFFNY
jgi:hypothetical protein